MNQIKKFIDRVSSSESRNSRDVILSLEEARFLRDEISKLLADLYTRNSIQSDVVTEVELVGNKW